MMTEKTGNKKYNTKKESCLYTSQCLHTDTSTLTVPRWVGSEQPGHGGSHRVDTEIQSGPILLFVLFPLAQKLVQRALLCTLSL